VILAAGMASRYGSMKQTDGFGPNGETIIEYSIYDAIKAGFGKVIFVIKEEFADNFKGIFEPKLKGKIETDYVFQTFNLKPFGIDIEIQRNKPWGTAHAVLAARDAVKEPFCVINADDFYGRESYQKMYDFLVNGVSDTQFSMIGFQIDKTLSEHGYVSRGVCEVDEAGNLAEIHERVKVYFKPDDTGNKNIVFEEEGQEYPIRSNSRVSMNFWGFTPKIFELSAGLFKDFALANTENPKKEFFIPLAAENLIRNGVVSFKVIPTQNQWFGVTYAEDKPIVQECIDTLVADGEYPGNLWA
jgi:NDP-sugar pyrophosphorylase family protein